MSIDKEYMAKYVAARYLKLKLKAIKYLGGSCIKCGYDKCHSALSFHHRDPNDKECEWHYLRKRSWNFIVTELNKCDLLCMNCHAEEHFDINKHNEALNWIDGHTKKPKYYELFNCMFCGKEFTKYHNNKKAKYCNARCSSKSQEKADYPDDLEFVKLVDEIGQSATGRKFGVSGRAIKKRYDRIKSHLSSDIL